MAIYNKAFTTKCPITPHDAAEAFCAMDSHEQADFFNEVARITSAWVAPFCAQMQFLTDSEKLADDGRAIMRTIGDYSQRTPRDA